MHFPPDLTNLIPQLELQRQQLINERQQFYKELIKVKHGGVINFPPPPTAEMIPGNATGAHPPAAGPTPPQHGTAPASGPPPHPGAPPPSGPPNYPPQHPYQPNTQVTQVMYISITSICDRNTTSDKRSSDSVNHKQICNIEPIFRKIEF